MLRKKSLSSEKSISLVARYSDCLFLGLMFADLGKINLSLSLELSDFIGKIKVFHKILPEIDFIDFNVIMAYCPLYIQR